ncbi:MAG: hypothetical protein KDK55_01760 [Chlamydiia bacterium]|nr:hypothetical protein [Chlamydiia bacterium]
MISADLENLRDFFIKEGYPSEIQEATEINQKQVITYVGKALDTYDLILRTSHIQPAIEEGSKEIPLKFLQFYLLLPFEVKESCLFETMRFICSINASFDLASFGLLEAGHLLYYRHVMMVSKNTLDEESLRAFLGSFEVLVYSFFGPLEAIATGKKSKEELEKEVKEILHSTP